MNQVNQELHEFKGRRNTYAFRTLDIQTRKLVKRVAQKRVGDDLGEVMDVSVHPSGRAIPNKDRNIKRSETAQFSVMLATQMAWATIEKTLMTVDGKPVPQGDEIWGYIDSVDLDSLEKFVNELNNPDEEVEMGKSEPSSEKATVPSNTDQSATGS